MKKMDWTDIAFIVLILINGGFCISFSLHGIAEANVSKIIWGMLCGVASLFWICVEGANHGP